MQQKTKKVLLWSLEYTSRHPAYIGEASRAGRAWRRQYSWAATAWVALLLDAHVEPELEIAQLGRFFSAVERSGLATWLAELDGMRYRLQLYQDPLRGFNPELQWPPRFLAVMARWNQSPAAYKEALALASLLRKVDFDRSDLKGEAFQKYLTSEARASSQMAYADPRLLSELSDIIFGWFRDFHILNPKPRHGPGVTARTGHTGRDKYDDICLAPSISALLGDLNLGDWEEFLPPYTFSWQDESDYTSKLIFVAKTWKSLRTVKPEPSELQYWQQAVKDDLYRYMERFPWCALHCQEVNRMAAVEASRTGLHATVDLSAASDSISAALVDYLFRGTELGLWLTSTRSHSYRWEDKTYPSAIFAGMGSALCFPVETIVFAACCEYIVRRAPRTWRDERSVYLVYGDDIIIASELYGPLRVVLENLSFQVNSDKSFALGSYRESCGVEALNGYDVTPPLYKIPLNGRIKGKGCSPLIPALVAHANEAMLVHGYTTLRWLYLQLLDTALKGRTLAWTTRRDDLSRPWGQSSRATRRWNIYLQRYELLGLAPREIPYDRRRRVDGRDELIAYHDWLRSPPSEPVMTDVYSRLRSTFTILCRGWYPEE